MTALVHFIAEKLVDHPEQVSVTIKEEGEQWVYELRVAPEDLGKIIGKQGRTAKAMRAIIAAAIGQQSDKRSARLEIIEEESGKLR